RPSPFLVGPDPLHHGHPGIAGHAQADPAGTPLQPLVVGHGEDQPDGLGLLFLRRRVHLGDSLLLRHGIALAPCLGTHRVYHTTRVHDVSIVYMPPRESQWQKIYRVSLSDLDSVYATCMMCVTGRWSAREGVGAAAVSAARPPGNPQTKTGDSDAYAIDRP